MLGLAALVVTVGLADSLNPSTVIPALYLAAAREGHSRVLAFTLGVITVNLTAGILLTLGPAQAVLAFVRRPAPRTIHLAEVCVGVALVVVGVVLWFMRRHLARHLARDRFEIGERSSLVAGGAIMLVELPTAFPYFAVIVAIVASGRHIGTQLLLVLAFNVAFVAPLLAIATIRRFAPSGGVLALERVRAALDRRAAALIPLLVLAIGLVVLLIGLVGLA